HDERVDPLAHVLVGAGAEVEVGGHRLLGALFVGDLQVARVVALLDALQHDRPGRARRSGARARAGRAAAAGVRYRRRLRSPRRDDCDQEEALHACIIAAMVRDGYLYVPDYLSAADRADLAAFLATLHPIWEMRYSTHRAPPPGREQRRLLRPVYWLG